MLLASILEILGINLGAFWRVMRLLFVTLWPHVGHLDLGTFPRRKQNGGGQKLVKKLGSS